MTKLDLDNSLGKYAYTCISTALSKEIIPDNHESVPFEIQLELMNWIFSHSTVYLHNTSVITVITCRVCTILNGQHNYIITCNIYSISRRTSYSRAGMNQMQI